MKTTLLGVILLIIIVMIIFLYRYIRTKQSGTLPKLVMFNIYIYFGLLLFVGFYFFKDLPYSVWQADLKQQFSQGRMLVSDVSVSLKEANYKFTESQLLTVPTINQYPELPRGCEVTALAMLMQYHDIDTDKLTLAKEVKKDPTPYEVKGGQVYFGNPHNGFVGNMYTFNEPGLGVYHEPLIDLANSYDGVSSTNLTGKDFNELLEYVGRGQPVFVTTNTTFKKLSTSAFVTWQTPDGLIDVTYKMHAVVITGFDDDSVYFNDPYDGKAKKQTKADFIAAWKQMGSQAFTIQVRN